MTIGAEQGAETIPLRHFIGGPCDTDAIVCCIITGGVGKGWTIVEDLKSALNISLKRRSFKRDGFFKGQGVVLHGLVCFKDWIVRLANSILKWRPGRLVEPI